MQRQPTEVRREQIKQAVLKIIFEEGLHNLSTRNIARRVGISEGALFRHYPSKRDVLIDLMEDVRKELLPVQHQIAFSNEPPEVRLHQFMCAHVRYLINKKGINILLLSEAAHFNDAELKNRLKDILLTQKQLAGKIFQDGIASGEWDTRLSVETLSMLYMGIPISLNVELILNPEGVQTENFCARMMVLLRKVLRK